MLYIDLDDFKSVNDSLGYDTGDVLLKAIAQRLLNTCRESDFVARLGGDEFCILIGEVEEDYAANVAKRCLEAISQPIEVYSRKLTPACSIGIAYFPDDAADSSALLKAADISLYTAKAEYRFQIEQSLREAIEKQQLSLAYQSQINIKSGEIFGVEALSRWLHPQLGQIPPGDFIATAERIGVIKPLTEWVLRTACNQLIA